LGAAPRWLISVLFTKQRLLHIGYNGLSSRSLKAPSPSLPLTALVPVLLARRGTLRGIGIS
jgi:hypothetical protein